MTSKEKIIAHCKEQIEFYKNKVCQKYYSDVFILAYRTLIKEIETGKFDIKEKQK